MKQNYSPYTYKFLGHVWAFCEEYKLLTNHNVVVALSGGLDSMALLWVFKQFYLQGKIKKKPRAITVDHQTRPEISTEIQMIKKQCERLGVEHCVLKVDGLSLEASNFEHTARLRRYESLFSDVASDEVIIFAHHLDDCFEWSLMQQFKSSNLAATLGIPVRRKKVRRPFFCVSRRQIERLVRDENIDFIEDSSNSNLKFERNFVRAEIVSKVKERFPRYLKHYVSKQLQYKSLLKSHFEKKSHTYTREWGYLINIPNPREVLSVSELKSSLRKLSKVSRGKISSMAQVVVDKFNTSRGQISGPYDFSGGVKVYHFGHFLLISKESEIGLHTSQISDSFPFLIKVKKNQGLKKTYVPFSKIIDHAISHNDFIGFIFKNPAGEVLYFI